MVEIPKKILSDLNFVLVDHMDEVVEQALRPVVKRGCTSRARKLVSRPPACCRR
jgi:ATP-dependent Lon protease